VHLAATVQLSPAAHALNPMVRFDDLSAAFGPAVVRGTDPADALDKFRELVDEPDPGEDPDPPAPPVPVEPAPVVEPAPAPVVEPAPAEVPDGPATAVLAWVDGDPDRARLALAAEGERAQGPRAGLTRDLNAVIAGGADE
jgi:hypothetical protein